MPLSQAELLLKQLPEEFDRASFIAVVHACGIESESTADKTLKRMVTSLKVAHIRYGEYRVIK